MIYDSKLKEMLVSLGYEIRDGDIELLRVLKDEKISFENALHVIRSIERPEVRQMYKFKELLKYVDYTNAIKLINTRDFSDLNELLQLLELGLKVDEALPIVEDGNSDSVKLLLRYKHMVRDDDINLEIASAYRTLVGEGFEVDNLSKIVKKDVIDVFFDLGSLDEHIHFNSDMRIMLKVMYSKNKYTSNDVKKMVLIQHFDPHTYTSTVFVTYKINKILKQYMDVDYKTLISDVMYKKII